MTQETKSYIKKATISNAEFIGQLVEAILGIVICIVGAVIGLSSETGFAGAALVLLVIGAYLAIGGLSGVIPYGIGALCEKGKYIAFDDEVLMIHSPNAKKCVKVPLSKIHSVKKNKAFSFDIMGAIWAKRKGCGSLLVEFENEKGKKDAALFGPIEACEAFIADLKGRIGNK